MNMSLDPATLLYAYSQGVFPMAHEEGIFWYDPDPRAILPLDRFHVSRSLQRTINKETFEIRINRAFRQVMVGCAALGPGRESTWISPAFIEAYTQLHHMGFAHSVECWQGDRLVGGLYGVSLNSLFAGESMFSRQRDASKVALVHLVRRLRQRDFLLLDVQFQTSHLKQFGAVEIARRDYQRRLASALAQPNMFV
jgi:leucyl/phenylalanyl-tRNA--protein transferase